MALVTIVKGDEKVNITNREWKDFDLYNYMYFLLKNRVSINEVKKKIDGLYGFFKYLVVVLDTPVLLSLLFQGRFRKDLKFFKEQYELLDIIKKKNFNTDDSLFGYDMKILDYVTRGKLDLKDYKFMSGDREYLYNRLLSDIGIKGMDDSELYKHYKKEVYPKLEGVFNTDRKENMTSIYSIYLYFRNKKLDDISFILLYRFGILEANLVMQSYIEKNRGDIKEVVDWVKKYWDKLEIDWYKHNSKEHLIDNIKLAVREERIGSIIKNMSGVARGVYNSMSYNDQFNNVIEKLGLMVDKAFEDVSDKDDIWVMSLFTRDGKKYMTDLIRGVLRKSALMDTKEKMADILHNLSKGALDWLDYDRLIEEFGKLDKDGKLVFKYGDGRFIVVSFKDYKTHQEYCGMTNWCTAYSKNMGGDDNFETYSLNGFTFTIFDTSKDLGKKESMLQITFLNPELDKKNVAYGGCQDKNDENFDIMAYLKGEGISLKDVFYLVDRDYKVYFDRIDLGEFRKSLAYEKMDQDHLYNLIGKYWVNEERYQEFYEIFNILEEEDLVGGDYLFLSEFINKSFSKDHKIGLIDYLEKRHIADEVLSDLKMVLNI
jgi:hypothetical protein